MRKDSESAQAIKLALEAHIRYQRAEDLMHACQTHTEKLFEQKYKPYAPWVIYVLARHLAGGQNLKRPFVDVDIQSFVCAMMTGKQDSMPLKVLCQQTTRFIQAKQSFNSAIDLNDLKRINGYLTNKKTNQLRAHSVWVGNPERVTYAFVAEIEDLEVSLQYFLKFLNDPSVDLLGRIMVGCHDFYHLHPFKDGNGRTWRCLVWHLLSGHYGDLQSLLIVTYFKLINSSGLYKAQKDLREGDHSYFINYWKNALDWSATSFLWMLNIFEGGYTNNRKPKDYTHHILEFEYYLKAEKRSYQHY